MKMNRFFMICAAMVTAAVSCNKAEMMPENEGPNVENGAVVTFTATSEAPMTRTAVDSEGKVTWTAGDQVAFYWQVDKADHASEADYPYVSEALTEGGTSAIFKIANASQTFVDAFIYNIRLILILGFQFGISHLNQ